MDNKFIEKAEEIINETIIKLGYCSLGLIDIDNFPTISTVTPAKSNGLKWITFVAGLKSNKVKRINFSDKASICFNNDSPLLYNITLVGSMEILTDRKTKEEMWYNGCEHHFNGIDDPNYCVLKFNTKRYSIFIEMNEISGII